MKRLIALAWLACSAPPALAKDPEISFAEFYLDNGLRVIVHEDHKAPIVAVTIWYHVGSKNETPGHTGFLVTSGKDSLLIWGDIVHSPALQFIHPEWAISFDTDQNQAIASRRAIFDRAAADKLLVAGMHLDFPGLGHVTRAGTGYAFTPAIWQLDE